MNGLISVIVPVYNVEQYLHRCVDSILNQTYSNLKLILVDDGSCDASGKICDEYASNDSRVEVIHQENQGVSSARNAGIRCSQGEYITFVDADDELTENALDIAVKYIKDNSADVVCYGWKVIDEETHTVAEKFDEFKVYDDKYFVIEKILENYSAFGGGYPWNKVWKKSAFAQITCFDQSMWYFEDLDWVIKMMLVIERMVVCPQCLYKYYYRETSATHSTSKAQGREVSYHRAIQSIINQLSVNVDLQSRFASKYYPEIVNGIIGARQNNYTELKDMLVQKLTENKKDIFNSLSFSMKLRFIYVYIMYKLRLL